MNGKEIEWAIWKTILKVHHIWSSKGDNSEKFRKTLNNFSKLISIQYFKFLNVYFFLLYKLEEAILSVENFTECRYSRK